MELGCRQCHYLETIHANYGISRKGRQTTQTSFSFFALLEITITKRPYIMKWKKYIFFLWEREREREREIYKTTLECGLKFGLPRFEWLIDCVCVCVCVMSHNNSIILGNFIYSCNKYHPLLSLSLSLSLSIFLLCHHFRLSLSHYYPHLSVLSFHFISY